jgi:hypothetical protein
MAFFKATRDQLKGNAFVSHLEFAVQRFNPNSTRDMLSAKMHISDAQKALAVLRKAEAEYILSRVGWEYVGGLCSQLETMSKLSELDQLTRDCAYMSEYCAQMIERATQ